MRLFLVLPLLMFSLACCLAAEALAVRHDPGVIEAESLTPAIAGDRQPSPLPGAEWRGGALLLFAAASAGETLTLDLPSPEGTLQLVARVALRPDGGDFRVVRADSGAAGVVVSTFAATPGTARRVLGVFATQPGTNRFVLRVTGKAPHSAGYSVGIDYLYWQPVLLPDVTEGEDLPVVAANGGTAAPEEIGDPPGPWSGGAHLRFDGQEEWGFVETELDVPEDGLRNLVACFTRGPENGVVQVSIDGEPLGGPVDLYAPQVAHSGAVALGTPKLGAGKHRLRFEVIGRNAQSRGFGFGLDCVSARGRRSLWARFTDRAKRVVFFAQEEAAQLGETWVSPEHLLLGLLRENDSVAGKILVRVGADLGTLRKELLAEVPHGPARAKEGMTLDPRARLAIDVAAGIAEQMGNQHFGTEHLLLAIIHDRDGLAGRVLARHGVTEDAVRTAIAKVLAESATK